MQPFPSTSSIPTNASQSDPKNLNQNPARSQTTMSSKIQIQHPNSFPPFLTSAIQKSLPSWARSRPKAGVSLTTVSTASLTNTEDCFQLLSNETSKVEW